jgi:endonuclease-3 related protein
VNKNKISDIYERLLRTFGPQGWWPAETPFEVTVGAILTQNTNWRNVARAIDNLKTNGFMDAEKLLELDLGTLALLIKPSGYYNVKAVRLRAFLEWFKREHDCKMESMCAEPMEKLREKLLEVKGIGKETADSILLYACGKPTFVVDAYTHRIASRHGLVPEETTYDEIKETFEDALPRDVKLFNEYHALLVRLGVDFCKTRPKCEKCPLSRLGDRINI